MTLTEFRKKFPQYNDMSDQELAERLHRKYYSHMSFEEFARRTGYTPPASGPVKSQERRSRQRFVLVVACGLFLLAGIIGIRVRLLHVAPGTNPSKETHPTAAPDASPAFLAAPPVEQSAPLKMPLSNSLGSSVLAATPAPPVPPAKPVAARPTTKPRRPLRPAAPGAPSNETRIASGPAETQEPPTVGVAVAETSPEVRPGPERMQEFPSVTPLGPDSRRVVPGEPPPSLLQNEETSPEGSAEPPPASKVTPDSTQVFSPTDAPVATSSIEGGTNSFSSPERVLAPPSLRQDAVAGMPTDDAQGIPPEPEVAAVAPEDSTTAAPIQEPTSPRSEMALETPDDEPVPEQSPAADPVPVEREEALGADVAAVPSEAVRAGSLSVEGLPSEEGSTLFPSPGTVLTGSSGPPPIVETAPENQDGEPVSEQSPAADAISVEREEAAPTDAAAPPADPSVERPPVEGASTLFPSPGLTASSQPPIPNVALEGIPSGDATPVVEPKEAPHSDEWPVAPAPTPPADPAVEGPPLEVSATSGTVAVPNGITITSPRDGHTLAPDAPPVVLVEGQVEDGDVSTLWLVANGRRIAVRAHDGRFRKALPLHEPVLRLWAELPPNGGPPHRSRELKIRTASSSQSVALLLINWPQEVIGNRVEMRATWRARPEHADSPSQRMSLQVFGAPPNGTPPEVFYLTDLKPGVYTFMLRARAVWARNVRATLYLPGSGHLTARDLRPFSLMGTGKIVVARVLLPQGVLWEQDEWFTGQSGKEDTVTKFRFPEGISWTERKGDLP